MVKWTLAIIAGGGAAAATQGATTLLRGTSTLTTGGLGNPVIATLEIVGAIFMSLLAIILPYLALIATLIFIFTTWRIILRIRRNRLKTKPDTA